MIKRQKCVGQQQLMAAEEVLFGNLPSWQVPTRVGDETLLVVGPTTFLLLHKHAFICQLQPCEIILEICLRQFSPLNVIWHQYSFHNSKRFAVFFISVPFLEQFSPRGLGIGLVVPSHLYSATGRTKAHCKEQWHRAVPLPENHRKIWTRFDYNRDNQKITNCQIGEII